MHDNVSDIVLLATCVDTWQFKLYQHEIQVCQTMKTTKTIRYNIEVKSN